MMIPPPSPASAPNIEAMRPMKKYSTTMMFAPSRYNDKCLLAVTIQPTVPVVHTRWFPSDRVSFHTIFPSEWV